VTVCVIARPKWNVSLIPERLYVNNRNPIKIRCACGVRVTVNLQVRVLEDYREYRNGQHTLKL
jgi:hypothetical protein